MAHEEQGSSNGDGAPRILDGAAVILTPLGIPDDRAAARFRQIAVIERRISLVNGQLATCKDHLKELRDAKDGLLEELRAAARDEGELPLSFDFEGP